MTETLVIEGVDLSRLNPMPHHLVIRWEGKKETKGGILIPQDRERLGLMNGEVLLVGQECDPRLKPGQLVQFSMATCEKEFLGSQTPGDRDPVFFCREEELIGILQRDLKTSKSSIELLNNCLLVRPELKPEERGGLLTVDREAPETMCVWGEVLQVDKESKKGFNVGDVILYKRNVSEDFRLGDFEAEKLHVIRVGYFGGDEVEAIKETVNG